jgi:hypothetical protein
VLGCGTFSPTFQEFSGPAGLWQCITPLAKPAGQISSNIVRLSPSHPLSPEAIRATLDAPGGSYATLEPLVEKHKSGLSTVGMDL